MIGGRGTLGALVCRELAARGHRATAIGRGDDLDAARGDLMVNCAGASIAMGFGHGWRGYRAVDVPIGLRAIAAARRCDARLVYVGAHHPPALRGCAYIDAHERVAAAMAELGAAGCVVRATGFFAAFAALLPIARRGWLADAGSGRTRTNPICERDLARLVADAALGDARELSCGGPEILTRGELFALVAAAAARRVRTVRAPVWLARIGGALLRLAHPRIGQFVQFAAGLARHDSVAPALGTTRLADYLAT